MIVGYMQNQEHVKDITTTIACRHNINNATATFVMNS